MDPVDTKSADRVVSVECHKLGPTSLEAFSGELVREEPLLITVSGQPAATLMCTPGDEISLALGFLLTGGVIRSEKEVGAIVSCHEEAGNVVRVIPADGADLMSRLEAHRTVFSSCSICGSEAIGSLTSSLPPFADRPGRLLPQAVFDLGKLMNREQRFYRRTGGTHAAVLGQVREGKLIGQTAILKEDIGRHNALDKVVGEALRKGMPLGNTLLFLSGRMSFEMVAKAARAGISDLAAVSAPTALAVELARRLGMLLVCFARGESATVYSGKEALQPLPQSILP